MKSNQDVGVDVRQPGLGNKPNELRGGSPRQEAKDLRFRSAKI
jgi:hypothetical protein